MSVRHYGIAHFRPDLTVFLQSKATYNIENRSLFVVNVFSGSVAT